AIAEARAAVAAGDPLAADAAVRRLQQRYTQAYLPFGDLVLESSAPTGESARELDLARATHTLDTAEFSRTAFVSAVDGVAVVDTIFETVGSLRLLVSTPLGELSRDVDGGGLTLALRCPADVAPTHEPVEIPVRYDDDPLSSVRGVIALRVRTDGEVAHDGDALRVTGARRVTVILTTATTFTGIGRVPDRPLEQVVADAHAILDAVDGLTVEELAARHRADHAALYGRAELVLGVPEGPEGAETGDATPARDHDLSARFAAARAGGAHPLASDPALAALLFHFGRYLLIASSRPGTLPATLQGIWNETMQPPWSSNYTVNINTQMNYWGAESTGLAELHEPLFALIEAMSVRGAETARRLYDARGWVAHHNADAWGYVSPVGMGGANPSWAFWPLAAPWLVRHLADHLDHGADEAFLDRALPLVRGAAEFLLDWFEKVGSGDELGTVLSTSPENEFVVLSADGADVGTAAVGSSSAMDLELARDVFAILVRLAERAGHADAVVDEARAALDRLPVPAIARDGGIAEWVDEPAARDPHHRHVSMLYGLYPGDRPWAPEEEAAASRSLDLRGDDASGWSLAWKALLRARLRQPEKVQDLLGLVFRDAAVRRGEWSGGLYTNLFAAHPPFQIDGNLGYLAVVVESLMQSHRGEIELLPALPDVLATGSIRGLVARPGVAIDLAWADGELVAATLTSRVDREVRVRYRGGVVSLALAAGESTRVGADAFAASA
ncbi:MAG: glycoside hydrolase N-terminal domain-containing protein, partial [Microbacteriaceae bacterium]